MKQRHFSEERTDIDNFLKKIKKNRQPISLLLDGLQDPINIGAAFRLADAARLNHIYLYRCIDLTNSKKWKRVARSTQQYVPYSILLEQNEVENLQVQQQLVALEWTDQSIPYHQFEPLLPTILVVGSEKYGVSSELLQLSERSIHIPMLGVNTSMNVMVATGIAIYHLIEK